jgi:hypothetical protein
MKVQAQQQTDAGRMQIEQMKIQMQDRHKQLELANDRYVAQIKNQGDAGEGQMDMAVQAQKLQESREAHQMQLAAKQQDMALNQQKADLAIQSHQLKANDMAQRRAQQALQPAPVRKLP